MSDNLKIWNAVKTVDPKYTKEVKDAGRQPFTNIDAYYLIERATEQFGLYGKGFGLTDMVIDEVAVGTTTLIKLKATFFHPSGSFQMCNAMKLSYTTSKGYAKVDEDAYKKIITNTISKALSYLGFGADVYMGKFEDADYVREVATEYALEEYQGYIREIKEGIASLPEEKREETVAWVLRQGGAERIETLEFDKAKAIAKIIRQKLKVKREAKQHEDT